MNQAILTGNKVYLRALTDADADGNYPEWFNDPEVCKYNSHGRVRNTREKTLAYIKAMRGSADTKVFAIVDKATNRHIGNISLQKINQVDRNAEIAIIVGEKEYWGRGYAGEAWRLVMDYGFGELDLHRLQCGTHEDNFGMQKLAKSCGMVEEGRLKEALWKDGRFADILLFGSVRRTP